MQRYHVALPPGGHFAIIEGISFVFYISLSISQIMLLFTTPKLPHSQLCDPHFAASQDQTGQILSFHPTMNLLQYCSEGMQLHTERLYVLCCKHSTDDVFFHLPLCIHNSLVPGQTLDKTPILTLPLLQTVSSTRHKSMLE